LFISRLVYMLELNVFNLHKNVLWTGSIDVSGLGDIKWDELFSLPKDYWIEDMAETRHFLESELGKDMPPEVHKEVLDQVERVKNMWWSVVATFAASTSTQD